MNNVNQLIGLASKTGKLYVASDVFDKLRNLSSLTDDLKTDRFTVKDIIIIKSSLRQQGTAVAACEDISRTEGI